ncbi:hypothetical protein BMF94_3444 [Rhodotorula taiwanensis]|uniref:Uncharacterized protein n=1 Tax=Rhodotorula taiwanensis TaxID=741276 RepID=A0A2S5B9Q8_9BASI|nr:hypothetical protein BMF94_3444 [Rhodotorula taiwanensis]
MLARAAYRPHATVSNPASWISRSLASSAGSVPAVEATRPRLATVRTRERYDELARLDTAAHRLAFRSIPYGSPPHVVFPPATVPRFTTSNKFFTLRCFPSQPRDPANERTDPPAPSPKKSFETPPPSLVGTTDPSPFASSPFLSTPQALRSRLAATARSRKPYTVDLTIFASKKKVHKLATVRERCKRRCREAVRLVIVRNASAGADNAGQKSKGRVRKGESAAKKEKKTEGLTLREDEIRYVGPRKWLMPGYHYLMNITLETYRSPLPELVAATRAALKTLKTKAEAAALEAQIAGIEIAPRTRLPDALPQATAKPAYTTG